MSPIRPFDLIGENASEPFPAAAIPARLIKRPDGSLALSVRRGGKAALVEIGPGFARILQRNDQGLRELTSSPAAASAAHVTSELVVSGRRVVVRARTVFARGTVRNDAWEYDGERLMRTAQWAFRGGLTARAEYAAEGRTLEFGDRAGNLLGRFSTAIRPAPTGYDSETTQAFPAEGDHVIIGSKTVQPGSSSTVIGPTLIEHGNGHFIPGPMSYTTVTKELDGTIIASQVVPDIHAKDPLSSLRFTGNGMAYSVTAPDGSMTTTTQLCGLDQNGQTFIGTSNRSFSTDGTWSNASGVVGTTQEGGFYSVTGVENSDGTSQKSSFAADGQGNSSETTVTYDASGGFTITTTSTDSNGNTTTNSASYDKDGQPTGQGGGGEGGGGDGDGDGNGGGGDGGGGGGDGGDDGSYPSDDGTDESPRHNWRGSLNGAFTSWLDQSFGLMGGSRSTPVPSRDPGDPSPMLIAACDDDIEGASRPGAGETSSDTIDLRPFLRREPDPEDNPRALIAALEVLAGAQSAAQLRQLAALNQGGIG